MYVFLLAWIVLPVYAGVLANVLPLEDPDVDRFLAIVVAAGGALAAWSGLRGGPMLLSEAQVLLGLAGGRTLPTRLAVVRQALFVGGFFGLGSAWLTALATGGTPPVAENVQRTAVGALAGVAIVCLAVLWNVDGGWMIDRLGALAIAGGMAYAAITGGSPEEHIGLLGLLTLASLVLAFIRAPDLRMDQLWTRSLVLAELQYGAALADYRSALSALRSARDGQRVRRGRKSGSGLLPIWLWRPMRSLSGSPWMVFLRVVVMIGGVAGALIVLDGVAAQLAAVAGILAITAVDFTTPLASVVSHPILNRASRIPERITLVAESAVGIVLTLVAGMIGFAIATSVSGVDHALAVAAIALVAGGSSVVQARLGNPDIAAIIDRLGPERVQTSLAIRAATPVVLLFLSVGAIVAMAKSPSPFLGQVLIVGWVIVIAATTQPRPEEAP
jgi:hypothetical protein